MSIFVLWVFSLYMIARLGGVGWVGGNSVWSAEHKGAIGEERAQSNPYHVQPSRRASINDLRPPTPAAMHMHYYPSTHPPTPYLPQMKPLY